MFATKKKIKIWQKAFWCIVCGNHWVLVIEIYFLKFLVVYNFIMSCIFAILFSQENVIFEWVCSIRLSYGSLAELLVLYAFLFFVHVCSSLLTCSLNLPQLVSCVDLCLFCFYISNYSFWKFCLKYTNYFQILLN